MNLPPRTAAKAKLLARLFFQYLQLAQLIKNLSQEERKHNQQDEEESRQCANPSQITFDVSVIRIEFSAARR
jgi:hypothetical protein